MEEINSGDEENNFNAINTNINKRKLQIVSDSENEEDVAGVDKHIDDEIKSAEDIDMEDINIDVDNEKSTNALHDNEKTTKNVSKRLTIVSSDSEDNEVSKETSKILSDSEENKYNIDKPEIKRKVLRKLAIIDSDSENDEETNAITKNSSEKFILYSDPEEDHLSTVVHKDATIYEFNKRGELIPESNSATPLPAIKKSTLYDSDTSEDEYQASKSSINTSELASKSRKVSKQPRKTKLIADPKETKMTAKQAIQQRQEIRSESQRMVRESRVSLPYHVPKSRSIKEFLQNRPKFASPLLQNRGVTPPSVAMKMSTQQLEIVAKKLEERNKEIQKFYESESESEEEGVSDHTKDTVIDDCEELNFLNTENIENEMAGKQDLNFTANINDGINNKNQENVEEKTGNCEVKAVDKSKNVIITSVVVIPSKSARTDLNTDELEKGKTESLNLNNLIHQDNNIQTEEMIDLIMPIDDSEVLEDEETVLLNSTDLENKIDEVDFIHNKSETLIQDCVQKYDDFSNNTCSILENSQNKEIYSDESPATKVLENSGNSMTYDFNLDEVEEFDSMVQPQSQENIEESLVGEQMKNIDATLEEIIQKQEKNFIEQDKNVNENEENVNEPEKNVNEQEKNVNEQKKNFEEEHFQRILKKYENVSENTKENALSFRELLKKQVGDFVPRLKIAPGEVICLDDDDDTAKSDGITLLIERFMKHAVKKTVAKHKVQLNVVNLSQGEIHEETIAMSVDSDEQPIVLHETPGLKLRKLRNDLKIEMAERRSELWIQRNSTFREAESVEKADYEDEAVLDDEEEAELSEGETTDGEIENDEEDYMEVDEESHDKLNLIDDQAEEDDEEDNEVNEDKENNEVNEDKDDENNEINEDKSNEKLDDDEKIEEQGVETSRKPRRLLLNPENSDSDIEDNEPSFKFTTYNESTASTDTAEGVDFPPNLPHNRSEVSPVQTKSQFSFLSPVQQLTGLRSLEFGSKLNESVHTSHIGIPEASPLKEIINSSVEDSEDNNAASQENLNAGQVVKSNSQESSQILCTAPTSQDLLDVCSGSFSDFNATQNGENCNSETDDNNQRLTKKQSEPTQINLSLSKEVKNINPDEDMLISELLDEKNLEEFKKKFDSPLIPNNLSHVNVRGGRLVIDSSDDENEEEIITKSKTKKKLAFSDDESDVESVEDNDEEIDLHEHLSEEESEEYSNMVVEYDSEENEIEVEVEEPKRPKATKSREFFENEAELSESDWDSEDEDEKGLDILENEQGDADVFDEDQMKNDLEKIHMRRILDQDNQEIKILQELLLEDGELHGTGRQRQFRWRNIDDVGNDEENKDDDAEVYLDEEESEEQWRKMRHEREMFLKNNQESATPIESDNLSATETDSQILKLGEEALRKSSLKVTLEKSKMVSNAAEVVKKPFAIFNTRGSFLARSDKFLTKLAEINKVNTVTSVKNSKKIVFEMKSLDNEDTDGLSIGKKRKATDGTPYNIKKLRLSSNLSPTVKNVERKKQLFN